MLSRCAPLAQRTDDVVDLFDRILHAEAVVGELHATGFDLAQIEDVVDELQQMLSRSVNVLEALLALLRIRSTRCP